ncbi:MAG: hypothetical protein ACRDRD_15005, partial [Pseudonocardiaceae bacterium]
AALARVGELIPGITSSVGRPARPAVRDALDTTQARAVGALLKQGGDPSRDMAAAHVAYCAQRRGWPIVTSDPRHCLPASRTRRL